METFVEKVLPKLLDPLYDAALDSERWPIFLQALGKAFGATGILHFFDCRAGAARTYLNYGSDPAFIASYEQHYVHLNPYPKAWCTSAPAGKVMVASDVLAESAVTDTEFYNDWMKPQGVSPHYLGAVLKREEDSMVLLGVAPHESVFHKDRAQYTKKLEILLPHLRRALEILLPHLRRAVDLNRAVADALQSLSAAAFLLDAAGKIVLANARAEELMRLDNVLSLDRYGKLKAGQPGDDRMLRAALVPGAQAGGSGPVRLVSPKSGRAFVAWVLPNQPRNQEPSRRLRVLEALGPAEATLLLVTPVEMMARFPADTVMTVFGLSNAEARLASALAEGRTPDEYAEQTGRSRNTVRAQLGAVFDKTATRRQSELVALLHRALAPALAMSPMPI